MSHGRRSAGRTAASYRAIIQPRTGPSPRSARSRINQAASDGVRVTASTSEVSSETTIVSASARKKTPVIPLRNANGMNTTTGVSVEATNGRKMSARPVTTASAWDRPSASRV